MFNLQLEWASPDLLAPRSGFDLGHMTFASDKGICSSRGKLPDQGMMLMISIKELLQGLRQLLSAARGEYVFVGTDSSFSIRFQKTKRGRIAMSCGMTRLGELEARSLCSVVLSAVQTFMGQSGNQLAKDDPVLEDLTVAIADLARAIE